MAEKALAVCRENRGATDRAVSAIARLLESTGTIEEPLPFPAIHVTAAK
jgi:hypothetical protein